MSQTALNDIERLEDSLWAAADNLRANSKLTSSEYCMPVLGIIFLRHATNRYDAAMAQIIADQAAGKMPKRALVKGDFIKRRALMLPKEARYDELLKLAKGASLGAALVEAMNSIERDFEPLAGQLPKEYEKFGNDLLEDILRVFDSDTLRKASGDVFGRIYEYFLMKFAMQGAQDSGEFFTPPSLVQTIVNVIEPEHGIVFDPACGSGGMFVQSSHFIERLGQDTAHRVTFFGQEKTATTIRLAKMNLAVHGLEGDVREANTFYEDVHELFGKCDFVMANPPFNVDMVDAEKIKGDRRLPFGLPGVNKAKKVSNGNYLWISYFHSYLGPKGRAGFVMSSQASSAGHGEAEVRRKIVETPTGDVDVIIAIRSNFFYTRTVPCELWHFDRGKPEERRDKVLMLDARNIYRKVTRKIYDFTPEQLDNLTAIVWLYRGQSDRFLGLVQQYLDRTIAEAAAIAEPAAAFQKAYTALAEAAAPFLKSWEAGAEPAKERDEAAEACFSSLKEWTGRIAKDWAQPCAAQLSAQHARLTELEALATACRDLVKDVDLVTKLAAHLANSCEKKIKASKQNGNGNHEEWDGRAIGRLEKDLDTRRKELVEQLKRTAYFLRQAHWLLSRFPEAKFVAVPGLCRIVTRAEIEAADWSLTPGRYVGVAPPEVDEDFDFEQALRDIHVELADLNREACALAAKIQANFEGLGRMTAEEQPIKEYALGIYDGPHATPQEASEGAVFLGIKNITDDGRLDFSEIRHVSEEELPRWTRRVTPSPGDVIFTYEATLHRYAVIPEGFRGCLGRRVALIRPNPEKANSRFLLYYFLSHDWRKVVEGNVISGATVDRIPLERFPDFPVRLPKLPAQEKIVDVLSAYDELIENNRRRMALLEESARLLYREWFVRLRFPGHEHTRIVDGLPDGWQRAPLVKITTKIGSGATPRGGEASYFSEGITLIRSLNVYDDRFDDDGLAFIGQDQAAALDNVTVESRDILLNITGASVARCCMAPERYLPARVNQHVMIIRVDPTEANPFFVHAAINSDERKRQLLSYAQKGSTREALTKDMMAAFEITLPSKTLMQQFGENAATSFLQRENLALQNQKLKAARDLLLPRLMNGEIIV